LGIWVKGERRKGRGRKEEEDEMFGIAGQILAVRIDVMKGEIGSGPLKVLKVPGQRCVVQTAVERYESGEKQDGVGPRDGLIVRIFCGMTLVKVRVCSATV
jgi:hypothetical protein